MKEQIPVTLVTGFLGSGKTTFLNWLTKTHPHLKISLILNEFGDVKLESQFIHNNSDIQIAELSNGCMCCLAKSDIPRVINYIITNSPKTKHIIIEASGLSDPDPIRDALNSLSGKVKLVSTICIVDVTNFEKTRGEHSIVMSQIGDADIILLNKIHEVDEVTVSRVKKFVESIGIGTKVILWDEKLNPNILFGDDVSNLKKEEISEKSITEHQHEEYEEFWFKTEKLINYKTFKKIMNSLPPEVIRSKGFINTDGKKILIQYVLGKLEMYEGDWEGATPTTAVLFLGKNLKVLELTDMLSTVEDNII